MMLTVLSENTASIEGLGTEHGLSLYIEVEGSKVLFDLGGGDIFSENAKKLGVDISKVEYLIISHGHDDHGGGLDWFFKINDRAKVFIHEKAFSGHFAVKADGSVEKIGLDKKFENHPQVVKTKGDYQINSNLKLFTNTIDLAPKPDSNVGLMMGSKDGPVQDDFNHEQNLIINENGKTVLITGCAHNGIINIMEEFKKLEGKAPDYCMGGFHLTSRASGSGDGPENFEAVDRVGEYLLKSETMYYTGHCTGLEPFDRLKDQMGHRVEYLSGGKTINI